MAGEWIVGGIEAKGFAWALVLWAMQALIRGRWNLALVLIGAATSLHVVVGGWAAVLTALVWLALPRDRASLASILPGIVGGILTERPRFVLRLEVGLGCRFRNHRGGEPDSSDRAIAAPFAAHRVSNRICTAASAAVGAVRFAVRNDADRFRRPPLSRFCDGGDGAGWHRFCAGLAGI